MTDCYRLLEVYSNPPAGEAEDYWREVSGALETMAAKHKNHPLAVEVGAGIMSYLERKWKAINKRRNQ